jgi:hypothetical protein
VTGVSVSSFLDLTLRCDGMRFSTFTTEAGGDATQRVVGLRDGPTLFAGPGPDWSVVVPA